MPFYETVTFNQVFSWKELGINGMLPQGGVRHIAGREGIVPNLTTSIEKEVIEMWWWVATIIVWLFSAA
ncbi:MAG: hypothetical protein ACFFCW_46180 [Candidatus Hodarchaeota archaeon]